MFPSIGRLNANTTKPLFRSEIEITCKIAVFAHLRHIDKIGCYPESSTFWNATKAVMTKSKNLRKPHLLLTNDDGIDSPLFELLIKALLPYGELSIAVPAQEQSWQGKSMTRHGDVTVQSIEIAGQPAYAIGGTPADCINIALYNLLEKKPDLVISGINVGLNAGLSLVWASGTVGACLEGNIAGIPGIALSQQLSPAAYQHWDQHREFEPATFNRLQTAFEKVLPHIFAELVSADADNVTWNVNLPFELSETKLVNSYLGHSWYQQCFVEKGSAVFSHRMQPFELDSSDRADINVLKSGRVSVSRLDIKTFGTLTS